MGIERDVYNEYGVKESSRNNEVKVGTPRLSVIIAVTVLFSVFNFVIGYMIGKFMGGSSVSRDLVTAGSIVETNRSDYIGVVSEDKNLKSAEVSNMLKKNLLVGSSSDVEEDISELIPSSVKSIDSKDIGKKNVDNNKPRVSANSSESRKVSSIDTSSKSKVERVEKKVTGEKTSNLVKDTNTKKTSSTGQTMKYYIQVSSNEKKETAESTLSKLKMMGLNGFIQEVVIDGKKLYRVRIGEIESYEDAMKILEKAKKLNSSAFLVVSK
ncbi:MAG: SPOR domain-containing protein, partial [Brevinematales bacterium]|nr:SPOR domain-containing protein [Brevinematales bacterium]